MRQDADDYWQHHGLHYRDINEGYRLGRALQSQQNLSRHLVFAETDLFDIAPGQLIEIAEYAGQHSNIIYRVINFAITYNSFNASLGEPLKTRNSYLNGWNCCLTLQPMAMTALIPVSLMASTMNMSSKPSLAGVSIATITGVANNSDGIGLDECGRYRVRFYFDENSDDEYGDSDNTVTSHSPVSLPITRVQFYGGRVQKNAAEGYGVHYPLAAGVNVAVINLYGNWDRPIIIGAIPNPNSPSPVTAANRTEHRFTTPLGHSLLFDDQQHQRCVALTSYDQQHSLLLQAKENNHRVALQSQHGAIEVQAEKDIIFSSDKSQRVEVAGQQHVQVKRDQQIIASKGEHTWRSARDIMAQANRDLHITSEMGDINLAAATTIQLNTDNFTQMTATGDYHINVAGGKTHFYANSMYFQAHPQGNIFIGHSNGFIHRAGSQTLMVIAQHVIIEAPEIMVMQTLIA